MYSKLKIYVFMRFGITMDFNFYCTYLLQLLMCGAILLTMFSGDESIPMRIAESLFYLIAIAYFKGYIIREHRGNLYVTVHLSLMTWYVFMLYYDYFDYTFSSLLRKGYFCCVDTLILLLLINLNIFSVKMRMEDDKNVE